MRLSALIALFAPLALTGCSLMTTTATPGSLTGAAISGKVHGGQQPIAGAHVYLMAANTTGYGGPGIAPSTLNASVSLLTTATGLSDTIGNYVPTAADGSFAITSDYACTPNTQVYLYALGGNPGSGTNSAAGLLALLGTCPAAGTFPSTQTVWVNEVTTIAAAYAFAGFASDATHVSSSGTPLAQTGIANAFANATNLVNPSTGIALTTTPAGNGTVPQQELNTLANILASCVNSTGPAAGNPCSTLFANALSAGTSGTTPNDTATAAINIAHNPAANVATLYTIPPPTIAFANPLTAQPNDFTVGLQFPIPNFNNSIAIDQSGNAWISSTNFATGALSALELSSAGALLSPAAGYPLPETGIALDIAIDTSGDAWIVQSPYAVGELSPSGAFLPGSPGYGGYSTGGYYGSSDAVSLAIDALGNAWLGVNGPVVRELAGNGASLSGIGYSDNVSGNGGLNNNTIAPYIAIDGAGGPWLSSSSNAIIKLSNAGVFLSGNNGFTGNGLNNPSGIAIDSAGNAWVANNGGNNVLKLNNSGTFLTTSAGFTGGGLAGPSDLAIDGANNIWVANSTAASITGLSASGSILSGATGYQGAGLNAPFAIAVDGSGNIWATNLSCACASELLGAATPVITPIAAGLPLIPTSDGSSNLGTRP